VEAIAEEDAVTPAGCMAFAEGLAAGEEAPGVYRGMAALAAAEAWALGEEPGAAAFAEAVAGEALITEDEALIREEGLTMVEASIMAGDLTVEDLIAGLTASTAATAGGGTADGGPTTGGGTITGGPTGGAAAGGAATHTR
jgi:membrane protein involved in colicin uptake